MKRIDHVCRALASVCACAVFLMFPLTAEGQSVSPDDYDVPVSTAQLMRLGATYNYTGSGTDVQTNDGSASLLYNRFYNSLPFSYDVTFNGVGTTRRNAADDQDNSYNFVVNAGVRKYFRPDGNEFYSVESSITGNNDYDRPAMDVTPGVGYGRFIQVTPLAQAVRIEYFLLKEGVVKGRLSKKVMIELAQVIEKRPEFETEYGDRYKIYWFRAMEEVIARAGSFTEDGLGAVGTLRVEEVLFQERINERYIGWDARAGVRLEAVTPYKDQDRQDPSLSVRARYSRPVSWKSQVDVNLQYTTPFNGNFGADIYTMTGALNYLYELTNRIDFTVSNIVTAVHSDPNIKVHISEQLRTGFLFFIENQINLNVSGQIAKDRGSKTTQGLNLAIEYRLR